MAKLSAASRKRMPKSTFGLPARVGKSGKNAAGKGAFPMPDKSHARAAISGATRSYHAGNISKAQEEAVKAKARKKLGDSKPKTTHKKRTISK